jgi:hypothetical protein
MVDGGFVTELPVGVAVAVINFNSLPIPAGSPLGDHAAIAKMNSGETVCDRPLESGQTSTQVRRDKVLVLFQESTGKKRQ